MTGSAGGNMATGDAKDSKEIPPGTRVVCTTYFDDNIEGEVVAFDYGAKLLIIKSSKNPRKNVTDTRMLNLAHIKTLNVTEVSNKPPPSLPSIELEKIDKKIASALEQKRRAVEKIGINVTPGAQKLFDTINKTINDVKWNGKSIVVMNEVTIDPPYQESDCRGNEKSREHIIKIVRKHNEEESNQPG
ncbi:protein LSM12 homolog [Stylophora pistillata]|uniref:Protein LSM12-like A n=1 Tax=Stylophora pistillata TaxID=50429 RepID=A0A2B4SDS9_STYPI|nr:protein LSM12 homolog [Stylophora pistillata]PFX26758.1 Protein LSM12-like A [Stylophora pistillata]